VNFGCGEEGERCMRESCEGARNICLRGERACNINDGTIGFGFSRFGHEERENKK
jgi:hypothetical protein